MSAPKGNRFWEQRSTHGRDKIFETPQLMWEAACEYFKWCEENPLIETDYRGAKKVEIPRLRAFTLQGLCGYLHCNTAYFRVFRKQLPKEEQDFNTIITQIEETIYNQKFTGAASGFLNSNIIARDLGLSDKKEIDHSGSIQTAGVDLTKLSEETLKELLDAQIAHRTSDTSGTV